MLTLVLSIVGGLIAVVLLAIFINKIPKKFHIIMVVVLLGLSAFFGYKLYKAIEEPVKFEAVKEVRYRKVIKNLIQIREAQLAHKNITGDYTDDISKLARFIDTAEFALTQQRDSTVADREKNKKFRLDEESGGYYKEITLTDTLGFRSVKDSLFKNVDVSKLLEYGIEGAPGQIELKTDYKFDKENRIPVFRARADKKDLLWDQPERLLARELEAAEIESVQGEYIRVGSLDEISTSGNWPRQYAPGKE
ncbi:MAG: hypothetical protein WBG46_03305 [Nonlabens sp.]